MAAEGGERAEPARSNAAAASMLDEPHEHSPTDILGGLIDGFFGLFGGAQPPETAAPPDARDGVTDTSKSGAPQGKPNKGSDLPGICVDGSQPVHVQGAMNIVGPMGTMDVYPDDFIGPLPPGAVHERHYNRMQTAWTKINDSSGPLKIDASSYTAGIDKDKDPAAYEKALKNAETFKSDQLAHLTDLAKTHTGLEFIEDLNESKHNITIKPGSGKANFAKPDNGVDAANGTGTDVTVEMNPALKTFGDGSKDWQTERPKYSLFHELVHANHMVDGDMIDLKKTHNKVPLEEWRTTGLGDYKDEKYSDNAFRRALGKPQRPDYGGVTW